mmetsp:Transcript_10351/g.14882  ORF Transcript_10351/g.14882 Transcript_10351/m.14882 type:complete len:253 (-) Transcript_10351:52-810(-)|eukprot:CAMPEP_0173093042 /NCGR_PEP_ID=MMETSP1102-20130122/29644_1 /TAXON_ID=49646 /ORGANISM="Geminigera sp., Strain Caron Lab Isolate" /LENGTH=252 /DNA_ID=CAMNT_0013980761 /DNA_START=36 /DNA_END=794 /DNA_ORIENTATION=+
MDYMDAQLPPQFPRRHAAAGDGLQAFPAFQNFPNSPKVRKSLDPYDHSAPGTRSPHGKRETMKRFPPRTTSPLPAVRFMGGHPYYANSQYEPEMLVPFDQDPISPHHKNNRHMTMQSPVSFEGRGSRLQSYSSMTRGRGIAAYNESRPVTQPMPFALSTINRSRRPASTLGLHPPGKQPGISLDHRLTIRDLYLAPPHEPLNTMVGSVKVTFRDIQAPKQSPKEFEFVRIANARASGSLFNRSYAGSQPLAV